MRRPSDTELAVILDGLHAQIDTAAIVLPMLAAQARVNRWHADGRLPVSTAGELIDTDLEMDCPDPTGETVVNAHPDLTSWDAESLRRVLHHVLGLRAALRHGCNQLPAVSASVNAHCSPTDGRTETERIQAKTGAVTAESACLVCDLGTSAVGPLTAGLCPIDHAAYTAAGRPERSVWIRARRLLLAPGEALDQAG